MILILSFIFYFFSEGCLNDTRNPLHVQPLVKHYTCPKGVKWQQSNTTYYTNGTYNEGR